jgi:hypothetical protein
MNAELMPHEDLTIYPKPTHKIAAAAQLTGPYKYGLVRLLDKNIAAFFVTPKAINLGA